MHSEVLGGLMGLVVGDALGVPVEFVSRERLKKEPVIDMQEYGSHSQPKGTWSDDSTMTLCLAESLVNGLDYNDVCSKYLAWVERGYMTPHGELFDIGRTTSNALENYASGMNPLDCGGKGIDDNGNGSLMRILPIAYYTRGMNQNECFEVVHNISKLTHGHMRSMMACGIYVQLAIELIKGYQKEKAYDNAIRVCQGFYKGYVELFTYKRILNGSLITLCEDDIRSTGYVVDTLEAAIWCLLTTDNYKECVLKAVNLGEDTDTVGAVAGGLAGILYGYDGIPKEWKSAIVKGEVIHKICLEFGAKYQL